MLKVLGVARVGQRPHPPRGPRPRPLPQRGRRIEMLLPGDHEPGPTRQARGRWTCAGSQPLILQRQLCSSSVMGIIAGVVADLVASELDRVHARIAGRFARAEPRARAREYVSGLVAGLERKNGWTLAERAGEASPDGMLRLLRTHAITLGRRDVAGSE